MRVRLDRGARTIVVLCPCGWRELVTGRTLDARTRAAWATARRHELRSHPGDTDTTR